MIKLLNILHWRKSLICLLTLIYNIIYNIEKLMNYLNISEIKNKNEKQRLGVNCWTFYKKIIPV